MQRLRRVQGEFFKQTWILTDTADPQMEPCGYCQSCRHNKEYADQVKNILSLMWRFHLFSFRCWLRPLVRTLSAKIPSTCLGQTTKCSARTGPARPKSLWESSMTSAATSARSYQGLEWQIGKKSLMHCIPKKYFNFNLRSELYRHYSVMHYTSELKAEFGTKGKCPLCHKDQKQGSFVSHMGQVHDEVKTIM